MLWSCLWVLHAHPGLARITLVKRPSGPHYLAPVETGGLGGLTLARVLQFHGIDDAFRAPVLPGGEAMRILGSDAVVHLEEADDGTGVRPEFQRETLRGLLLGPLAEGTVRWGRSSSPHVCSATPPT